ncbi:DNA-repair protein XRCC1 isoform X1 [Oryza glaberrima]|uniref:BRCT domain-containing protein n=1 Tax=Oryza glaberrima TaxID=4538 RepID=I1PZH2_ORYGL|nr:DNA-repair protein XRCC1 isoform X1 [Oryza glaberrima]XP_052157876.1 DNA-repair protein XRCC1 isoform X1 [Oryza glaberrima]XP_052157877.1 DNA-repair protein XRCC1 isoform X1 [Oryza glaberrima]XP_052157878.1 DNA-repair protein XRCC1 isoform X1 [Oryza glaberrima]
MPESSSDPNNGRGKSSKRNLPSWMGSKDGEENPGKKKHTATHEKVQKGSDFSKLLDGVVFVLSGFVNPERGTLRSQALDMGAEYRPDWTSDCTLLVCAFANTPKFRQVESDNGTIVSKDWILESHSQRKLVDIEPYLMHVGKPWRKNKELVESDEDQKKPHKEHQKQVDRSHIKTSPSAGIEAKHSDVTSKQFSPTKIKQWAKNDLAQTISWLESQEEKPEPNELKAIAAEGVITCLQDAIESLKQGNDVKGVAEQWSFVPHVVNELAELDGRRKEGSLSKEQLSQLAIKCKKIYQAEFAHMHDNDKKHQSKPRSDDAQYDSDDTIEMTEEEIDLACRQLPGVCGRQ